MFGGKAQKHWKYIAQNQRLPLCQTNFGTREKKQQNKTNKETKKEGWNRVGNSLLLYFDQENSEISKASLFNFASRKFLIVMFY